jgi:hypothetical protein
MIRKHKKERKKRLSPSLNKLPYEIKWLLSFVNLDAKKGTLNPPHYALNELKRKPEPSQEKFVKCSFLPSTELNGVDEQNNIWKISHDSRGKPFSIKVEGFPVQEFKNLLTEKRMPGMYFSEYLLPDIEDLSPELKKPVPDESSNPCEGLYDITEIPDLWCHIKKAFHAIAEENLSKKYSYRPDFLSEYFSSEQLFDQFFSERAMTYSITERQYNLTVAVAASFFNFYFHQRDLRNLLRCCYCCGQFFIPQHKKKFCSNQCNTKFHRLPKEKKAELEKQYRKIKKENRQKREYKEMLELLKIDGCSATEAAKEARKWIYEEGKSVSRYKKDR